MAEIGGDPAMEEDKGALVQNLIDTINEIVSIFDYRCVVKKQYCNLARRLKLLTPMFLSEAGIKKGELKDLPLDLGEMYCKYSEMWCWYNYGPSKGANWSA
ncbi:hypothetical protein FF2_045909 [Malus domestica]